MDIRNKKKRKRELSEICENLPETRIALLCGSALGDFADYLEIFLLERGIRPSFFIGDYNRYYEEAVYGTKLLDFSPDVIYFHTTRHNIVNLPEMSDTSDTAAKKLEDEFQRLKGLWEVCRSRFKCLIIQNNFEPPTERALGNLDCSDFRGHISFITELNRKMSAYARESSGFLLQDIAWLAAREGLSVWHNAAYMHLYKYAVSPKCMPVLAGNLASVIAAAYGRRKKCIVVDLDNTLWGGVIGEVGASGIEIGIESAVGEEFAEFQKYLKRLIGTGVLLAAASKNEEDIAKSGFAADGMLLRMTDFACFYANWRPKHENIVKIAEKLNIGVDSIVFIDDNPAERELIAKLLPEVCVIDANSPQEFIRVLDGSGYFELASVSGDDINRAQMYCENDKRLQAMPEFDNYEDFLKSLSMKCSFSHITEKNLERVTALINKTNQFNMTTLRMTEAEVSQITKSAEWITVCGRLSDKFGDNGLVTVFIGQIEEDTLTVTLWVMSCRVFGRQLELVLFDEVVRICLERGISRIIGVYKPTNKNRPAETLYETLGFSRINFGGDNSERLWDYVIPEYYKNKTDLISAEYEYERF